MKNDARAADGRETNGQVEGKEPEGDLGLAAHLWRELADRRVPDDLTMTGPHGLLPSVYDVSGLAGASVAVGLAAIAELAGLRTGRPAPRVRIDRRQACALFRSERYVAPVGWELPAVWDPIAGDYATRDGFIRLHTNYPHHRAAALAVLGVAASREAVAAAVRSCDAEALEQAVVDAGGCAAAMRSPSAFARHPQGVALAGEPLVAVEERPGRIALPGARDDRPLAGIRVLDLTRVIAGPICTRLLAAYGADVLRVDPPGFEEVGALVTETTVGKRRAFLDLRVARDRARFEALLGEAHLLVHGLRNGALEALDYSRDSLAGINPALSIVREDAYGWSGPWAGRRGFDSLVQMSAGIAQRGMEAVGAAGPRPLPAQALDHATGYLMAAAACVGVVRALERGVVGERRLSLARTGLLLQSLGDQGDPRGPELSAEDVAPWLEDAETALGPVRRVGAAAGIEGIDPRWDRQAGPLGSDAAAWSDA
jgi:hypothetical protein